MFGWIPLIGPIIQGLVSIFNGFTSLAAVKLQTASQTTIAETQASAQIIHDTNNDIALRILRDMAILPVVGWTMLIGWDTIVAYRFPSLMWHVASYPPSVQYLPYVVLLFLFGNIGFNTWKRL